MLSSLRGDRDADVRARLLGLSQRAQAETAARLAARPLLRRSGAAPRLPRPWLAPTRRPLRVYATDIADEQDQLAGWGIRVVMDEARRAGAEVEYVQHPPRGKRDMPDAWLVSLPYAGNAGQLASFFAAAGVEADRERRRGGCVFLLGGHAVINPEPFLDCFDGVFVGEADDQVAAIVRALEEGPEALASVPGVDTGERESVTFQVASGLHKRGVYESEGRPGVATTRYLEIARGCRAGCRFCELGWLYGYDERPREEVESALREPGNERLVLSAPDTDGVSYYADLVAEGEWQPRWRSTRVTPYVRSRDPGHAEGRKRIRFGVEGVTERLRLLAGKRITDEQLREALRRAAREGYHNVRVFLIAGLPTEGVEDRTHVAELLDLLRASGFRHRQGCDIKVTGLSPQPLTPWQREGIQGAILGLSDYHEWQRRCGSEDRWWGRLLLDRHTTEADVVKHMRRGELLPWLAEEERVSAETREAPAGRRWEPVRAACYRIGYDYDARLLRRQTGELPWSRVQHPHSARLRAGERSADAARGRGAR